MAHAALGFKRCDHITWTVADVDAAADFYILVLGASLVYRIGPIDPADLIPDEHGRDWTDAHLGLPGARFKLSIVELPDGFRIQLIQFAFPDAESAADAPVQRERIGAGHLGIEVQDIESASAFLSEHGCTLHTPFYVDMDIDESAGFRHCVDPWGHTFELVERR